MIEMVEILRKLSKNFPKRLAAGYDHVGLQTGKKPGKVQKIFLSLDLDWEVLPLGDGHTHKLEKPSQIAPDTDIGTCPMHVAVVKDSSVDVK